MAQSAAAKFRKLFDVNFKGDIGSPRVAGSTSLSRSLRSVGFVCVKGLRPAPLRRMQPFLGLDRHRLERRPPADIALCGADD
ncbi:hypothetical protein GCM10007881_62540 [Mesorhizobium huakuii]|nr:hypothetical protein GCM10007881_62540 [Mesorhizobium huakuii]